MRRGAAAAGGVALTLLLAGAACGEQRPQLTIHVGGSAEQVREGTTFAEARDALGLRPHAGNLIDVRGRVLRRGIYPGRVLLGGRPRAGSTILRAGDRIEVVAGPDRREGLMRRVVPVAGGVWVEPQFKLIKTPGVEVTVRGAVSHELVWHRYEARPGPQRVDRAVALTFDDGPWPGTTLKILAVLKRFHVKATFFAIGFQADAYPELIRAEHRAGMTVGNHTYNHPEVPPFNTLPRQLLDAEIQLGAKSLLRGGVVTRLLRPPAGSTSTAVVRAAQAANERVVLWSVDPTDWVAGRTPAQIKQAVLQAVQAGSIVDLHDGGGDRSATIKALPGIIKGIRHKHLRLVALQPQ